MRTLFVQQLHHVGFHRVMGVESSSAFFEGEGSVHLTSVFVHPVFVNDKGLNSIVNLDKSALLRESLLSGFAKEAEMLTEAVIFPLGKVATAASMAPASCRACSIRLRPIARALHTFADRRRETKCRAPTSRNRLTATRRRCSRP